MGARTRVAVVFGGPGAEHDRSAAAAADVVRHLDRGRFAVTPIRVSRHGAWVVGAPDDRGELDGLAALLRATRDEVAWSGLSTTDSLTAAIYAMSACAVVFPLLRGGAVQALLELLGVPYAGNGVRAFAATGDLAHTRSLLTAAGLTFVPGPVAVHATVVRCPDGRLRTEPPAAGVAVRAYHALGCTGLLEVGFAAGPEQVISQVEMLPSLSGASVAYPELLALMLETGLARG